MSHRTDQTPEGRRAARAVLFTVALGFWLLLAWPVSPRDGSVLWADLGFGVGAAALVAITMRELVTRDFTRLLQPRRYLWLAAYVHVLAWYVLKANLDVARRVLHPALPIRPGIVAVHTRLRTASARTALATSITLTPGTLAVDITDDGLLYVHWIDVTADDETEVTRRILGRFEWFLARIFE